MDEITEAQRRIGRQRLDPRTRTDYRRRARWWELEAMRGSASAHLPCEYAENMRWIAELTMYYGPGTFQEILQRSGIPNPYAGKASEKSNRPAHLRSNRMEHLPPARPVR